MSINRDMLEEYKADLADRYTAVELVDILGLTEWDILEMFEDKVLEIDRVGNR